MRWRSAQEIREDRLKPVLDVSMGRLAWLEQTSILDIFKEIAYADGEKQLDWRLPGKGKSYLDCGEIKVKGCDHTEAHPGNVGFARKYKRSCARKECPVCFEAWSAKEAMHALIRFAGFVIDSDSVQRLIDEAKHEKRKEARSVILETITGYLEKEVYFSRTKIKHVVVSPPQNIDWKNRSIYMRWRRTAYQVARSRGVRGGLMVPHPYRLMCSNCGHKPIPDYKKECPECGNSEFAWYFSPHFHIVGFGWVGSAKEGYEKDGWVVKNLGVRNSVFWTLQYILSHAGVSWTHVVTWFGAMAYNKSLHPAELGRVQEHCPFCDRILWPLVWLGGVDRPPPKLEFSETDSNANVLLFDLGEWGRLHS